MIEFQPGQLPLLISFPHSGTEIPDEVSANMTDAGRAVPDTDWFLPRLYDFEPVHQSSQIRANFSRYVIDPNRPPDGTNLYPGQPTPELCPLQTFTGEEIYVAGSRPDAAKIQERMEKFWKPYHRRIRSELDRIKQQFGFAVLYDVHSIASRVPRLFEGILPNINIGTAHAKSCDATLESAIDRYLNSQSTCSHVINGRFIGGYITRCYGQPADHIHAVQIELSQATYMDEPSRQWHDERAAAVRPTLKGILDTMVQWINQQIH